MNAATATAVASRPAASRITIRPLTPVFGAEITGVDLRNLDDATFAEIEAAFEEYSVLVFPDQPMDDPAQQAFSRRFGDLEFTIASVSNNHQPKQISHITNVGPDGKLLPLTASKMVYQSGNEMWHSDSSFKRTPAKASLLSGREVPPRGGETEFATGRAAWDALPAEKKAEIEDLVAIHSFGYSRGLVSKDVLPAEDAKQVPPVPQRVVRANPVNGRKNLFVGAHAEYVEGMPREAGWQLLRDLTDFMTQPQFTYKHRWRQHDLVMWDNRCTLHRGHTWDKGTHRRVMHRTTVAGTAPTVPL